MPSVFARHGIPDMLVLDNGPQFSLVEFKSIKMVKHMIRKARESGCSEFLALLKQRNNPTESI